MSTYKLYYYNIRGRAEVARLIFATADQKYEDIRFEHNQWPLYRDDLPLGHLPVLQVDGTKLPHSTTIARFLARRFHLAGADNFEQAKVDAVVDTILDLVVAIMPSRREHDETKKQELTQKFLTEALPKQLEKLEIIAKLYSNGGSYFVGNNLTWADLFFYDIGQKLLQEDESCLNDHSWLKQNRAEVEKQPRIAKYLRNRSQTEF